MQCKKQHEYIGHSSLVLTRVVLYVSQTMSHHVNIEQEHENANMSRMHIALTWSMRRYADHLKRVDSSDIMDMDLHHLPSVP